MSWSFVVLWINNTSNAIPKVGVWKPATTNRQILKAKVDEKGKVFIQILHNMEEWQTPVSKSIHSRKPTEKPSYPQSDQNQSQFPEFLLPFKVTSLGTTNGSQVVT